MDLSPALFLDRDGVINVDHGYVHRIADFEFMPGIFDLVRCARAQQMRVVVVTNQAGIGRGLYTEADFAALTQWMCERFAQADAGIDRVYHCPTHPTAALGAYRVDSPLRKPHPGMLLAARSELALDLGASALVGDKLSDMQAGLAAGVGLNMLLEGGAPLAAVPAGVLRVHSLAEAAAQLRARRSVPGPAAAAGYTARP